MKLLFVLVVAFFVISCNKNEKPKITEEDLKKVEVKEVKKQDIKVEKIEDVKAEKKIEEAKVEQKEESKKEGTVIEIEDFDESAYKYTATTQNGKMHFFKIALKGKIRGAYYYENNPVKKYLEGNITKTDIVLTEKDSNGKELNVFNLYAIKEKEGLFGTMTNLETKKTTKIYFEGGNIWPTKYENIYGFDTELKESEVESIVIDLKKQILDKNKEALAKFMNYPLNFNISGPNYTTKPFKIKNEKEFLEKFDTIMTDDFIKRIKETEPMNLFCKYGISFGDRGEIWLNEKDENGKKVLKVVTINH